MQFLQRGVHGEAWRWVAWATGVTISRRCTPCTAVALRSNSTSSSWGASDAQPRLRRPVSTDRLGTKGGAAIGGQRVRDAPTGFTWRRGEWQGAWWQTAMVGGSVGRDTMGAAMEVLHRTRESIDSLVCSSLSQGPGQAWRRLMVRGRAQRSLGVPPVWLCPTGLRGQQPRRQWGTKGTATRAAASHQWPHFLQSCHRCMGRHAFKGSQWAVSPAHRLTSHS